MNIYILSSLFSPIYFIGEAKFETQNSQSDLIGFLDNYHRVDGLEKITPISVIQEIYASNNPGLLTMLQLSFSELFHNTQIWASPNSSNVYLIKPRSDALMLEGAKALKQAASEDEKGKLRSLINNKISLLNRVFTSNEFQHLRAPNIVNQNSPKEDLVKLVDKDKIISSFRVETLHNILVEGCAMLELAEVSPFETFTSDQLIWTRDYWNFLTRAYGPQRSFLSRDKQIMNSVRFSLFSLIESRLHRVESRNYQNTLDSKILTFLVEFTKLIENQNLISIAQKAILAKLGSLEPGDTISNSGLNEEECVPCPEIGPI